MIKSFQDLKPRNFYWILQICEIGEITLTQHKLLSKTTKTKSFLYEEGRISKKFKVAHFSDSSCLVELEMCLILQDNKFINRSVDCFIFKTREDAIQYLINNLTK